jgi:ABC-type multidrug transport system ATPase subunit
MSEMAITTDELKKHYSQLRAVDGLNLRVPSGSVYGFLGRNGAGKTSTIKLLLGLMRPTAGAMRVLGLDPQRDRVAILERTGYASESKKLYDWMTAAELLRFTRSFYPAWSMGREEKYARQLDIPLSQPFKKLSLGNRTKVCLLLALAQRAHLLILDEPMSGLDPGMLDELLRILAEDHLAEGGTVFLSSHQLSEVEQIADWVGIIEQGKLLLEARLEDIKNEFRLVTAAGESLPAFGPPEVLSATRAGAFWKYVVARDAEGFAARLRQQGATVTDVSALNLRQIFLELTRKEEPCTRGNGGAKIAAAPSLI